MHLVEFRNNLLENIVPKTDFKFPVVISSILTCFKVYGQEGGIIGGAVRDHVLDKKIKDYDVYIQTNTTDITADVREIEIHTRKFGYTIRNITAQSHYEDRDIVAVYKLTAENGTTVDIIFGRANIQEHVDNFTCDISKIWYNVLQGKIVYTTEFMDTVKSKVCMICDNRGSHPAVIEEYVDKLKCKYPEYQFTEE